MTAGDVPDFPEHAKAHGDWAIREFLVWAMIEHRISVDEFGQWLTWLLEFRGVDVLDYRVESAQLRSKYRWLYDQFKVDGSGSAPVERAMVPVMTRVVDAALPTKGPDDGLAFLMDKIRSGVRDAG